MTEQDAVYCLKAVSERYPQVCEECQLYGQTGCDHCYDDANDVAIKALEKQIPKKPKGIDSDICPNCGTYNSVIPQRRNTVGCDTVYCWHCGTAIECEV